MGECRQMCRDAGRAQVKAVPNQSAEGQRPVTPDLSPVDIGLSRLSGVCQFLFLFCARACHFRFAPAPDMLAGGMERTFAMIKPDGVRRGLTPEILARIQRKGYRIVGLKQMVIPRATAEQHYAEHKERPFFGELVDFITGGPVVAIALEGENAIAGWRAMMGATNPANAAPGSIRADFATTTGENVTHGSDSPESAQRELGLFFKADELL